MKKYVLIITMLLGVLYSCKKEKTQPAPPPAPQVLLKDIVIPSLPSPYYQFTYDNAGRFVSVSHASGLRMYDVEYTGNRIHQMKNNTFANKDRLEYIYNEKGRPDLVKYINEAGSVFRISTFAYNTKGQLVQAEWERRTDIGFIIERTIDLSYRTDGNILEIIDHRLPVPGQTEATHITRFDQYDNKINTDGFSLLHEGSDHLMLLPGVTLQKNNPLRLVRTGTGNNYTIDYTYTYSDKNVPLTKNGDAVFTSGPNAGQRWQTNMALSYYP